MRDTATSRGTPGTAATTEEERWSGRSSARVPGASVALRTSDWGLLTPETERVSFCCFKPRLWLLAATALGHWHRGEVMYPQHRVGRVTVSVLPQTRSLTRGFPGPLGKRREVWSHPRKPHEAAGSFRGPGQRQCPREAGCRWGLSGPWGPQRGWSQVHTRLTGRPTSHGTSSQPVKQGRGRRALTLGGRWPGVNHEAWQPPVLWLWRCRGDGTLPCAPPSQGGT